MKHLSTGRSPITLGSIVAVVAIACLAQRSGARAQETSAELAPRKPNIVVLYADDAGYADFGFQKNARSDVASRTPHIDSIAKRGATFTQAYMSGCVCSPSRAGLLTGRYQTRFGHEGNIPPGYMKGGLPLTEKTVGDRMRALGYRTALVGKWHLGYPADYHPNKRGFDWFYGCLQGSRSYFPMKRPTPHRVLQENGKATPEGGYATDRFGDAAVRFIEKSKAEPFFLFVSFTAPHGPLQAKEADLAELQSIENRRRRRYVGLIKALDDNVGKILAALKAHGLDDDTLVVFTNDNGGQTKTGANNAPLRGRKGTLLEGGIRVPMCMRFPGHIAEGSRVDDPVIALDLLPSFVALGGGEVDPAWSLDGVNLMPRVTGRVASLPERSLFWRHKGPGQEIAMRRGRYKLCFADRKEGTKAALYDLATDAAEARDLAADESEKLASMREALEAWEKEQVKPLWTWRRRRKK